jgi:hypothetical protein
MIRFVTSFSAEGYEQYAKNMLFSVLKYWKDDLQLIAYHHDVPQDVINEFPVGRNIEYRNLNDVEDMLSYREHMKLHDGTEGGQLAYNWRMDAIKWCHKVYAMTDLSLEISEKEVKGGWLIWLDADTVTTKPLSEERLLKILPEKAELVHLGRKDADYSETSFIAFNLDYQTPHFLLADFKGCYDIGEVVSYREWHDGFIFERLLKIYIAHGMKVHNLTPKVEGLSAFADSPLSQYMSHLKGNLKNAPSVEGVAPDISLPRYNQLAELVRQYATDNIVEVGTWNAGRAIEMSLAAFEKSDKVHYMGFDLFEEATEELDIKELNSKAHNTLKAVEKRLIDFANKMNRDEKVFSFELFKGDSKDTLKKTKKKLKNMTFAFIDGGHSEETVLSDYKYLKHVPCIVFDDFFSKDVDGNILGDEYLGTNRLVNSLNKDKRITVLPSQDRVKGGGRTHLAVLLNGKDLPDIPIELTKVPIVINPKDSVPKEYIWANINKNVELISKWDMIKACSINQEHAIIISGGPSTDYEEVRRVQKETNGKIICVKHSYPDLLEACIQPWACVILDPRPITGTSTHGVVRSSLFEHIDDETNFFIASMTDPSVTNFIQSKTDKVQGWHAFSQAVATQVKSQEGVELKVEKELNISEDAVFVNGGTCAAMRSIGMMHIFGFRNFHLFGFDCSIDKEPSKEDLKKKIRNETPKFMKVETNGKEFWTTGELLAMAQDCEKLFDNSDIEMNVNLYGEGTLVKEIYDMSTQGKKTHYSDLISTTKEAA